MGRGGRRRPASQPIYNPPCHQRSAVIGFEDLLLEDAQEHVSRRPSTAVDRAFSQPSSGEFSAAARGAHGVPQGAVPGPGAGGSAPRSGEDLEAAIAGAKRSIGLDDAPPEVASALSAEQALSDPQAGPAGAHRQLQINGLGPGAIPGGGAGAVDAQPEHLQQQHWQRRQEGPASAAGRPISATAGSRDLPPAGPAEGSPSGAHSWNGGQLPAIRVPWAPCPLTHALSPAGEPGLQGCALAKQNHRWWGWRSWLVNRCTVCCDWPMNAASLHELPSSARAADSPHHTTCREG